MAAEKTVRWDFPGKTVTAGDVLDFLIQNDVPSDWKLSAWTEGGFPHLNFSEPDSNWDSHCRGLALNKIGDEEPSQPVNEEVKRLNKELNEANKPYLERSDEVSGCMKRILALKAGLRSLLRFSLVREEVEQILDADMKLRSAQMEKRGNG